jgi:hypothetical protein
MIIPADLDNQLAVGTHKPYNPKRKPHPKTTWEIKIHSGILMGNFKRTFVAHKWFTAVDRAILAWGKEHKTTPKKLLISIRKK